MTSDSDAVPDGSATGASSSASLFGGSGRHAFWAVLPHVLSLGTGLFTLSFNVRVLGANDFGILSIIISANGILGILSSALGLAARTSAARAIDDPTDRSVRVLRTAQTLYFALGAVVLLLSIGAAFLLPVLIGASDSEVGPIRLATMLLGITSVVQFATAIPFAVVTAHERFASAARLSIGTLALRVFLLVLLVPRLGLVGNALVLMVAALVEFLVMHLMARRLDRRIGLRPIRPNSAELREVLGFATAMTVVNASNILVTTSDSIMIGALVDPSAVTTFRLGITIPGQLLAVVLLACSVIYPRLVRSGDEAATVASVQGLSRFVTFAGALGFGALACLTPSLVTLLAGGVEHATIVVAFVVCAGLTLECAAHFTALMMLARGAQGLLALWAPFELVINLVATAVLLLWLGVVGAALAGLLTFVLSDYLVLRGLMKRARPPLPPALLTRGGVVPSLAGFVVAIVVLGPLALLNLSAILQVAVLIGAALFLVLGLALGAGPTRRAEVLALFRS